MPPVVAVITTVVAAVSSFISAVAAFSIAGIAVGRILLTIGLNLAINALFAPKKSSVAQRQAQTLELTLGEVSREALLGLVATGGTLLNAWNDGAEFEFETQITKWADHEIDGVVGFMLDDRTYTLTTQGAQTHADFQDGGPKLWIEWRLGAPGQTVPSIITNYGIPAGEYTAQDTFTGLAYVVVRYQVSQKVWPGGRPRFRWIVRGAKCYDPRLDSTVEGGSGSHRWGQPSTYTWSDNARICHYNYIRGIWNYAATPPQLMVGPGRSAEEAPPADVIADANLCDENVSLKAGGTEKRYRVSAVIRANERWIDMEEHFAAAMGGELVERGGTIGIDPGAAKAGPYPGFTDKQLLRGADMSFQGKVTRDKLINTVVARFVDPNQLWEQASAPMRRSLEDIATDGEVREQTIDLVFVSSNTQAQRCAEIIRRKNRLQPAAVVPLGPAYMQAEDGDWIEWTSDRRFAGETRVFEVQGVAHSAECNVTLALKQTAASVYTWNPAVDELDATSPAYLPPGALPDAVINDFEAEAVEITSAAGISTGAIRCTWTPPNDGTIIGIELEFRPVGALTSTKITAPPSAGEYVISVLPLVDVDYEVRAVPLAPGRTVTPTAWRLVELSAPLSPLQPPLNFTGIQSGDTIRFVWTRLADPSFEYEIRCGPTFDLGRFVDRVVGGATVVVWPIASEDDDLLFWIKTRKNGVYSAEASLWVAVPNDLGGHNFILAEDFQADMFPGIRHDLTDAYVGDEHVLELAHTDTLSLTRGDYYASVSLIAAFSARTWLEHRASAYINDTSAWDDDEQEWDDDEEDWLPDIGDAGGDAMLDAFIAVNSELPSTLIEGFRFNDTLEGVNETAPTSSSSITYAPAKAANGAHVAGSLAYEIPLEAAFSKLVDVRLIGDAPAEDKTLIELTAADGQWLKLLWRVEDERWVLEGNYADEIAIDLPWEDDDTVSAAVWQSADARGLVIASRANPTAKSGSVVLQ